MLRFQTHKGSQASSCSINGPLAIGIFIAELATLSDLETCGVMNMKVAYEDTTVGRDVSKGVKDMTDAVVVQGCRRFISIDSIVWIVHGIFACKIRYACLQRRLGRSS